MDKQKQDLIIESWNKYKNTKEASSAIGMSYRTYSRWIERLAAINIFLPGYRYVKSKFKANKVETKAQIDLNIENGVVVVFSDAHIIPNQDLSVAAKALLTLLCELKPQYVLDGGDTFDLASISKHDKLGWKEEFTVAEEIEAGNNFLDKVRSASKCARHIMLGSNHDVRFNKFLAKHAPQMKGVKGFTFEEQVPHWEHTMCVRINNNVIFLHQYHGGVHAAWNNTLKGGITVINSHTHILEVKPFSDYSGTRFGVQTGTLSTIHGNPLFDYTQATPLNWQAGFVVLTFINGKLQYPEICHVNDEGNAFFRGKLV